MMICKKSFFTEDLNKYFQDPELLFEQTTFHFKSKFKDKRMAVVKLGGAHFVAQEFSSSGINNLLLFVPFRATRAFRAWFYGNKLANKKILCAKPLLFIEKRLGPFRSKSYLLVNYITGLSGGEYFENLSAFKEHWPLAVESIHQQLLQLEDLQIKHIDFGLDSFMIKLGDPYLIDLENIKGYKFHSIFPKKKISHKYFTSLKEEIQNSNSSAYELFDQKLLRTP